MTSTSLCICPVRSLGGRVLPAPLPGPITKQISDAYVTALSIATSSRNT